MRHSSLALASMAVTARAASLSDICSVSAVQAALPSNGTLLGMDLLPSTVTAGTVYNASSGQSSTTTYSYCNVTVSYQHTGKDNAISLKYAFPDPSDYKSRFYVAGGGGFQLSTDATGGLAYGAASGATDAGYDAFSQSYEDAVLDGNGTINWDNTYMFSYQALGEMAQIGKAIAASLYDSDSKIYTYFEGCSDGGREGMSQVQRYPDVYDGVVAGAPALRFSHQQVLHVFPSAVLYVQDYFPTSCELEAIVNATLDACDSLDGRTDGVVSRTDLCKLNFNLTDTIGTAYYCAASNSTSLGFGFSRRAEGSSTTYEPAANGTVSAEGVAIAQAIYDGLFNSAGQQAYLSWQIGSELSDAVTEYNSDTGEYELGEIPSTGGEYVARFVELLDIDNIDSSSFGLQNETYDILVDWMQTGLLRFTDTLQTTVTDLRAFRDNGGKLLHYHGESDPSIPSASSVHYLQSVLNTMGANASEVADWYQFYLIPGAAHCGSNSLQPNGPYPEDNMATIIAWVEDGVTPTGLNATVTEGDYSGEVQSLCRWPLRPLWSGNSSSFDCVEDEASIESWTYSFDAFELPVY